MVSLYGDIFFLGAWVDGVGSGAKDSSAAVAAISRVLVPNDCFTAVNRHLGFSPPQKHMFLLRFTQNILKKQKT